MHALAFKGYPSNTAELISLNPIKFLWPGLLSFFEGKMPSMIEDCIQILTKLPIQCDPGQEMNKLIDIFSARQLIVNELKTLTNINLSLPKLLIILEQIQPLQSETISSFMKQDPSKWEVLDQQLSNKKDILEF